MCGRPIHIASSLGRSEILRILIKYGGDPHVIGAVCYPEPHHSNELVYNDDTQGWGAACLNDVYTTHNSDLLLVSKASQNVGRRPTHHVKCDNFNYPLYYAIKCDRIDCVRILMEARACELYKDQSPLLVACALGSKKCAQYFIEYNPELINSMDSDGFTPLHRALRHGKEFVQFLVQKGAVLSSKSSRDETMLHLLFSNEVNIGGMSDLCQYLLDCGLNMTINAMDQDGNSALHLCLRRVHYNFPVTESEWIELQECVNILLINRANPNISNRKGDTPLHILVDIFDFGNGYTVFWNDFGRKYDAVESLLEKLLQYNANPNIPNKCQSPMMPRLETPLMMFIHHLFFKAYSGRIYHSAKESKLGLEFLHRFRQLTVRVITLLCEYGGVVHLRSYRHGKFHQPSCPIQLLLAHLGYVKVFGSEVLSPDVRLATDYLSSMLEYLRCLLKAGCTPDECDNTNQVEETFSMLFNQPLVPFSSVYEFTLVLLQYGANPNACKYVSYDGVMSVDFDSYPLVKILLTETTAENVNSLYTSDQKHQILSLFINCMDRRTIKQCFDYLGRHGNQTAKNGDVYLDIFCKPQSLKSLSAKCIFASLQRKIAPLAENLPLPVVLKRYLSSLQF